MSRNCGGRCRQEGFSVCPRVPNQRLVHSSSGPLLSNCSVYPNHLGGLFLKCRGPDLKDLDSLNPSQHQRMCLFNMFPQWCWESGPQCFPCSTPFSHLPAALTHIQIHAHIHTCTHVHAHTHTHTFPSFFLPLYPQLHPWAKYHHKFSEGPFWFCLHPLILLLFSPYFGWGNTESWDLQQTQMWL